MVLVVVEDWPSTRLSPLRVAVVRVPVELRLAPSWSHLEENVAPPETVRVPEEPAALPRRVPPSVVPGTETEAALVTVKLPVVANPSGEVTVTVYEPGVADDKMVSGTTRLVPDGPEVMVPAVICAPVTSAAAAFVKATDDAGFNPVPAIVRGAEIGRAHV